MFTSDSVYLQATTVNTDSPVLEWESFPSAIKRFKTTRNTEPIVA